MSRRSPLVRALADELLQRGLAEGGDEEDEEDEEDKDDKDCEDCGDCGSEEGYCACPEGPGLVTGRA